MQLLKYRAFTKFLKEAKLEKARQDRSEAFKKVYSEKLSEYGVTDAAELADEQLHAFLESMKSYKTLINQNQ
jgi:hypothetical protein